MLGMLVSRRVARGHLIPMARIGSFGFALLHYIDSVRPVLMFRHHRTPAHEHRRQHGRRVPVEVAGREG